MFFRDLYLQGRVRTKTVKKAARVLIESYYSKLTRDFHINKRVTADVAIVGSKRLRNRIAGYLTHLMKRIQAGPIRGISIKLQEEERERRDNYQPDVSVLTMMATELDPVSTSMVNSLVGAFLSNRFFLDQDSSSKRRTVNLYKDLSNKRFCQKGFILFAYSGNWLVFTWVISLLLTPRVPPSQCIRAS